MTEHALLRLQHILGVHDNDTVVWSVRAFYILSAYAILIVRLVPDLHRRFLDYGARNSGSSTRKLSGSMIPRLLRRRIDPLLDLAADITVPHGWFVHFYICSTICSACWLYSQRATVLAIHSAPWDVLLDWSTRSQIALALLQAQGLRRLYECLVVSKSSSSRMWVGHYAIGLAFYIVTNIAVWLEPALELDASQHRPKQDPLPIQVFNTMRIAACVLVFAYSSVQQYRVHSYLASLKEYRVPDHPLFESTNVVCPHYSYEIYIYLALSVLTAKDVRVFNLSMLCATVFVAVNLGVTADLTKQWQLEKFPKQMLQIAPRKRILSALW